MVPYVRSNNVLQMLGVTYLYPSTPQGLSKIIPVVGTVLVGPFWLIPVQVGSGVITYKQEAVNSASPTVPPTPDSVKMLILKNNDQNQTWGVAIANSDEVTTSAWNTCASAAAGTVQVMPAVTVPLPVYQFPPVSSNGAGTNVFVYEFPLNGLALQYLIPGVWFNGIAPTTAYAPAGITTLAGLVTWANTSGNWNMYGTWSAPTTTTLQLSSPTSATIPVNMSGMVPALSPKPQCLDATSTSTPAAVNGVQFGSGPIIPFPAFMLTNTAASLTALINSLQPLIPAGTFVIQAGNNKITITTVQGIVKIYNNASVLLTASAVAYGSVCP